MTRVSASLLLLAGTAWAGAGCNSILGNDDHSLAPPAGVAPDGSPGPDSAGPLDGSPGADTSPSPEGSPEAGGASEASVDAATEAGCMAGATRCNGNTPQECVAGLWKDQTPCGGSTPVCSNGGCGTYRTTGGIVSTAASPAAADAGIHLASGGFELGASSCDEAGMCVTGGLVP